MDKKQARRDFRPARPTTEAQFAKKSIDLQSARRRTTPVKIVHDVDGISDVYDPVTIKVTLQSQGDPGHEDPVVGRDAPRAGIPNKHK